LRSNGKGEGNEVKVPSSPRCFATGPFFSRFAGEDVFLISAVLYWARGSRQETALHQVIRHFFNCTMQRINEEIRLYLAQRKGWRHHIKMAQGPHQKPPLLAQV